MKKIRSVLITRSDPRHVYFANFIAKHVDVLEVFFHCKTPKKKLGFNSTWKKAVDFFSRRKHRETNFFFNGRKAKLEKSIFSSEVSNVNSEEFVEKLRLMNPELIFTFGCGILKNDWYFSEDKKIVNLHSGIIPEYRGVDSVYWCMYNEHYDKIGFTIHFIDRRLDMGKILLSRPSDVDIGCSDSNVFFKVIDEAIREYPKIIQDISLGRELSLSIPHNSDKIYYAKDRGLVSDLTVWKNLFLRKVRKVFHGKKSC